MSSRYRNSCLMPPDFLFHPFAAPILYGTQHQVSPLSKFLSEKLLEICDQILSVPIGVPLDDH